MFTNDDLVSSYLRQQAIDDGVLVDVTELAQSCGIRYPVAVTAAVFAECERWTRDDEARTNTTRDVRLRVLDLMRYIAKGARSVDGDRMDLCTSQASRGAAFTVAPMYAIVGPGDAGEPVITVMLVGED